MGHSRRLSAHAVSRRVLTLTLRLHERHASGDWGDLSGEDKQENDFSIKHGFRILSSYKLDTGVAIWIVTEADRSATTLLLPEEY